MRIADFHNRAEELLRSLGPLTTSDLYAWLDDISLSEEQVQSLLDGGASAGRWLRNGAAYLLDTGDPDDVLENNAQALLAEGMPAAAAGLFELLVARNPADMARVINWALALARAGNPRIQEANRFFAAAEQLGREMARLSGHAAFRRAPAQPGVYAMVRVHHLAGRPICLDTLVDGRVTRVVFQLEGVPNLAVLERAGLSAQELAKGFGLHAGLVRLLDLTRNRPVLVWEDAEAAALRAAFASAASQPPAPVFALAGLADLLLPGAPVDLPAGGQTPAWIEETLQSLLVRYRSAGRYLDPALEAVATAVAVLAWPLNIGPVAERAPASGRPSQFAGKLTVAELFRPGGALEQNRPGYRHRPDQMALAEAIEAQMTVPSPKLPLLGQAPTGTGKSLAYIAPSFAAARRGEQVVVATSTKNLQAHLIEQEIPSLAGVLGQPIRSAVLVGVENYVCPVEAEQDLSKYGEEGRLVLAYLPYWLDCARHGLVDELFAALGHQERFLPVLEALRAHPALCGGPGHEQCPFPKAQRLAAQADIMVVNHHLLVSQGVPDASGRKRHLIIDEAHNLEDSATSASLVACGTAFLGRVARLGSRLAQGNRQAAKAARELSVLSVSAHTGVRAAVLEFSPQLHDEEGVCRLVPAHRSTPAWRRLVEVLTEIAAALTALAKALGASGRTRPLLDEMRQVVALLADLRGIWRTDLIYWVELQDDKWAISSAPLDAGPIIQNAWQPFLGVTALSATLSVGDAGQSMAARWGLGLHDYQWLAYPSPFDWAGRAALVHPSELPAYSREYETHYVDQATEAIAQIAHQVGGRALVLFASRKRMELLAEVARPRLAALGLELLVQEQPSTRSLLTGRMRQEAGSVLFGLASFWEGVDFPGRQVQCVMIESLPFAAAGDPVIQARTGALNEQGRDGFSEYYLAKAALRFAQGCGRLLRTEQDAGLVVVLDKRLAFKDYGSRFIAAAPPFSAFQVVPLRQVVNLLREKVGLPIEPPPVPATDLLTRLTLKAPVISPFEWEEYRPHVRLALERIFRFGDFRPHQEEIIRATLTGQPVFAILQTGAGKSVCYQLPALLRDGLTLVITPVIALMKDQVDRLRAAGVTCVDYLASGQESARRGEVIYNLLHGKLRLLYISPERLALQEFRSLIRGSRLVHVVVDEAHCVSQWGHTFRPDFFYVGPWVQELDKDIRVSAFTATASQEVRKDILKHLPLAGAFEVVDLPDRTNLTFRVQTVKVPESVRVGAKLQALVELLREGGGSAIVYTATVASAEMVAEQLNLVGIPAACYSGGLNQEERTTAQDLFMDGTVSTMVCTNAFGMGVDKPDVRQVIHFDIPVSLEAYYQEVGRAGRDGTPAVCTLLHHPSDLATAKFLVEGQIITPEEVRRLAAFLASRPVVYATEDEVAKVLGFNNRYDTAKVRVLRYHFRRLGWLNEERLPYLVVILEVNAGAAAVVDAQHRPIITSLQQGQAQQDLLEIAVKHALPLNSVAALLERLAQGGWLRFHTASSVLAMRYNGPVAPDAIRKFPMKEIQALVDRGLRGVEVMKRYAESTKCRVRQIHGYLGSHLPADCGRCDNCRASRGEKPKPWFFQAADWTPDPAAVVLEYVAQFSGRYSPSLYIAGLAGLTQYNPPEPLVWHSLFGRLAHLGYPGVRTLWDQLHKQGLIEADGRARITETGKQRLAVGQRSGGVS